MTTDAKPIDVLIYAVGVCMLSACAAIEIDRDVVVKAANATETTGLDHGWAIADENFATGEPNPCPCNNFPTTRRHWLLSC